MRLHFDPSRGSGIRSSLRGSESDQPPALFQLAPNRGVSAPSGPFAIDGLHRSLGTVVLVIVKHITDAVPPDDDTCPLMSGEHDAPAARVEAEGVGVRFAA